MRSIAITGASGYIGGRLVSGLLSDGGYRIKLLRRNDAASHQFGDRVELVTGDLLAPASLQGFLEPGCIVVNLVYLWDAGEEANIAAARNLVAQCKAAGISRLIHVSTAAVSGRVDENLVDEATPCMPVSEYGTTKLKVEALLRDESQRNFDLVILRPTAVFGPGAEPLAKLVRDIFARRRFRNYVKSSLFGKRRMNLVHVANVVAAIIFLSGHSGRFGGETFIVSDDDADTNNFRDVESALMRGFGLPDYAFPRLPLPLDVLRMLLLLLGRNNINPRCNYSGQKLQALGFQRPMNFEAGLADYIASHTAASRAQETANAGT